MTSSEALLEAVNLTKSILLKKRIGVFRKVIRSEKEAQIVSDVSFKIKKGESFGLAGLPGCGKSVIVGLITKKFTPTGGRIFFEGKDVKDIEDEKLHQSIKVIFSDPAVKTNRSESFHFPSRIVKIVELRDPSEVRIEQLAFRERKVELAMALASNPKLIIVDEHLKTLSKKNLLKMLKILENTKQEFDITYLLIHDDLGVMKDACDRFAVMFRGRIVEKNSKGKFTEPPLHPYAKMLDLYSKERKFQKWGRSTWRLRGALHLNPFEEIPGCQFHRVCPYAMEICRKQEPSLIEIQTETYVACHLLE